MKKIINFVFIFIIMVILVTLTGCTNSKKDNTNYKIVTSFYPIYIMTLNIVDGASNVEVSNMADANTGCVHNYTLQTADLKKVENANLFIQNGLEIENFMDKLVNSFSKLNVVNSSEGIENVIQDEDEINGHTWTSINNYIKQLENIKNKLKEENPENAEIYEKNTNDYIEKLNNLKEEYDKELEMLKGEKVLSLNEAFSYIERDVGLDTIEIHTDHEESTISADKLKEIIEKMKDENIKIIIIDKDDNERNAQTIAKETNSKIYKLDSCLKGDMDKESYVRAMKENLNVFKKMIENK